MDVAIPQTRKRKKAEGSGRGGGYVWVTRYRSAEQEAHSLLYILLRSTVSSGSASFIHPSTSSARAILLHQRGDALRRVEK